MPADADFSVCTYNVNSIKARLPNVLDFLREAAPDVVCLQEIKCVDEAFPRQEIEDLGYNVATHGQKSYNGVALLSKFPLEDVRRGLAGEDTDEQARYIEAVVLTPGAPWRVASIYLPNGNPVASEKFPYKLRWMQRLAAHAADLLALEERLVLAGDYNVIPRDGDCHDPAAWQDDALFQPQTRASYRTLQNLGLVDAFMAVDGREHVYTFWDYQAGAWAKDHGIRIDHFLLSPEAADRLRACAVARAARGKEKASDHAPVIARFAL